MFRESDFDKMEMPSVVEFDPLSDAEEVAPGQGRIAVNDDEQHAGRTDWPLGPSADDGRKFDDEEEEEVDFDVDDEDDDDAAEEESDAEEFDDDDEFDDDLDDDDDDDDDDLDDDE